MRPSILLAATLVASALAASPLDAAPFRVPDRVVDEHAAVVARGNGPPVVLLSGLLGGTGRMTPLAERLAARGYRVLAIDVYRLAREAPDVSFHGLARLVSMELARSGITSAVVVAHGHASGVAMRLAANATAQVHGLVLLDAGLVESTRSSGVARALQMASFLERIPGGGALIRSTVVQGIRRNSGDARWLTPAAARTYVEPLVTALDAVARMAQRLASATEPEPPRMMLGRVRSPIAVLVGAVPHASAPAPAELDALAALGTARIRRLDGVGHFVHEEVPGAVIREVDVLHGRGPVDAR